MGLEWIKAETAAFGHRKVKNLARQLNIDPIYALAHLESLWRWAITYARDGYLAPHTDAEIAEAMRGDLLYIEPAKLVQILVDSGFLDETEYGLYIHQWEEYEGAALKSNATAAERKRASRARLRASQGPDETVTTPSHPVTETVTPSHNMSQDGHTLSHNVPVTVTPGHNMSPSRIDKIRLDETSGEENRIDGALRAPDVRARAETGTAYHDETVSPLWWNEQINKRALLEKLEPIAFARLATLDLDDQVGRWQDTDPGRRPSLTNWLRKALDFAVRDVRNKPSLLNVEVAHGTTLSTAGGQPQGAGRTPSYAERWEDSAAYAGRPAVIAEFANLTVSDLLGPNRSPNAQRDVSDVSG